MSGSKAQCEKDNQVGENALVQQTKQNFPVTLHNILRETAAETSSYIKEPIRDTELDKYKY